MKKFILLIASYLLKFTQLCSAIINKFINHINFNNKLKILHVQYNKNVRYLEFTMLNVNYLENKEAFFAIYNTLMNDEQFIKFGIKKIL